MHFTTLVMAWAALAVVNAKVAITNSNFTGIANGVPFTITWAGQNGPVTLKLNSGPALVQVFVGTIATGQTGQSFDWTPSNIVTGNYIFEIDDSTDINYSIVFPIAGIAAASTTTSSSSSSLITTTSASTSASVSSSGTSSAVSTRTAAANSTSGSPSGSTAATKTTSSSSSTPTTGNAVRYGSPLALVLTGLLAFACLN